MAGLIPPRLSYDDPRYLIGRRDDPVSIGIAIISAVEVASGIAIGFEAAALVGTIAIGAAITGAQYALQKLTAPKPISGSDAATINAPEVRGNVRQSAPVQRLIYGAPGRVGGAVCFLDDTKPPYLVLGLMHSRRPISRFKGAFLGENEISFAATTNNTILDPVQLEGQNYWSGGTSRLKACFRNGDPNQTIDALVAANYPDLAATFRQQGIPTSFWRFEYGADVNDFEKTWGQVSIPSPFVSVEGAPIYDPRDPTQRYPLDWRDAADVAAAMATWKYSNTAALVQADWLGYPAGLRFRPDQIRWDEIARAAEFDEEVVTDKDGTPHKRHTIDGVVMMDQTPNSVAEAMGTANRGFFVTSRGRGWVSSSQPREPVFTITDDMMMGAFEFRGRDRPNSDLVNRVQSRFSSDDREYQEIDGPIYDRPDLQEEDGELLPRELRFPFTPRHQAVQRLEKQYVDESRLSKSWAGPVKLIRGMLGVEIGDVGRIESRLLPEMNDTYVVDDAGLIEDVSGVRLVLNQYDKTIATSFNPATDERDFTLPALKVS